MSNPMWYVVKKGRETGVFETWEECKVNVVGYKGAKYKGFTDEREAYEWLWQKDDEDTEENKKKPRLTKEQKIESYKTVAENLSNEIPPDKMIAYIDGSFDAEREVYSCGCIIIKTGNVSYYTSAGHRPEARTARNVAGELLGAMYVSAFAAREKIRDLTIYHDYYGISKWYEGEWKAQSFCAQQYLYFMEKYRPYLDIKFVKVAGHTGDPLNEYADLLAKEALKDYK